MDEDIHCYYCGKSWSNMQALRAHLRFCEERKEHFRNIPSNIKFKLLMRKWFG